jgi:membrane-bound metal-dependent hydrolase YbcI (DUF457 family)
MPSPIGHALGGLAAGALIAKPARWRHLAFFALAGALADIDFLLPIRHRGPTHSLGVAVLVLAAALAAGSRLRVALAIAAAYASHVFLDWVSADTSTPRGLMALWPLSSAYYISSLEVFRAIDRRYWLPGFWSRNAIAVAWELLILAPISAGVGWFRVGKSAARSPERL